MRGNRYPAGYRDDEDMYVYDQCCDNCCNPSCPMEFPESAEDHYYNFGTLSDYDGAAVRRAAKEVARKRKEDGIIRDGNPIWCIYWEGGSRRRW